VSSPPLTIAIAKETAMPRPLNRRQFVQGAGAATAAAMLGAGPAAAAARVHEITIISQDPHYHGWPTVVRRRNGELLVACSGGREQHVCPFGKVELIRSADQGQTWSWPRTILDLGIDNRDAGILETARGALLATTFTSLAYEPLLRKAETSRPGQPGAWAAARLARWLAAERRLSAADRRANLGVWTVRSSDGGRTWAAPCDSLVNSPHGPVQLSDGRLLYAGVDLWRTPRRVGVGQSTDDGQSWQWLAAIPVRPGDRSEQYHELHAVEARDGRLIVQIRNHNQANAGETLQCESSDGGRTWSVPHSIGAWGLPSHLLRLSDGRLLMTYGYRRKPFGNQARVSEDDGRSWSAALVISDDGEGGDLGYPSTVQLADGSLLTVWYESRAGAPGAVLRQARWELG
jgi:hypothetical protein